MPLPRPWTSSPGEGSRVSWRATPWTLAYLLQREQGAKKARAALWHLLSKIKVAPTTHAGMRLALAMDLDDFEDAVCVASAQEAGCTAIVTDNPQHFRKAGLPALLPEALVAAEGDDPETRDRALASQRA